ncbi:MAG: mandelate racemase/muconate lactonizing enzyme family protein [Gammaproteobacteria bacterium]|nr:mandelate racemase/muconate lactonizing enzyme family protein [Gammaproteobacteria bacterium]
MIINKISLHSICLNYEILSRARAHVKSMALPGTVVAIHANTGLVGYGEAIPLAPSYLPMLAQGTQAGVSTLAPELLGKNPLGITALNDFMQLKMRGFADAKSAIDLALWDLLGKQTGLPAHTLLGGRQADRAILYNSIPHDTPEAMVESVKQKRAEGVRRFQVKVGADPEADIERLHKVYESLQPGERAFADANRGWLPEDALRVINGIRGLDLVVEQPCDGYEACLQIRRQTGHPIMLDEIIDGPADLMRAINDRALDIVVLKLAHMGGLTPVLLMARMCLQAGIRMRIEDTVGCELSNAAVAHLGVSLPPQYIYACYQAPGYGISLGETTVSIDNGDLLVGNEPGLGVRVDPAALGDPLDEWEL